MTFLNINTAEYWNGVYQTECQSGAAQSQDYSRDYGPIHEAIIGLIPEGSRVLDIACGPGLLCRKIKQTLPATQVLGVDFADYMIVHNQARDQRLGVAYRCLDIRNSLGLIREQYDVVMMCEILEHLEEPGRVLADAMGLLRTGGLFILSCPHDDEIPDPEHLREWGHDEIFHLLAPYSQTVSFTHFPPPYFHIWMLAHLIKAPVKLEDAP